MLIGNRQSIKSHVENYYIRECEDFTDFFSDIGAQLNVKPRFCDPLNDVSAVEASEIVLDCRVVGKPTPSITWYKDGLKLLMENRMLCYTDRRGVARLNIMNATLLDAGSYACEAINAAGKDFTHCVVRVIGKSVCMFI